MDNTLYCGIARDVIARFEEHKKGTGAKYTRSHKPESIVYVDIFDDKSAASKEEYRIKKTLTREQKLELIQKFSKRTSKMLEKL
ncbi:MAG: GIY-YIG nuclease family protein [Candidatus Gastranaerophilales bacterium]|nr:GIY-YIG nuclease family protein [Candidatus Gastranaerophilales bacterium]